MSGRIVKARSGGFCEARVWKVCKVRAAHIHHRRLKSQGGSDDPDNLLHVCLDCHRWIHDHPTASKANDWIRTRATIRGTD